MPSNKALIESMLGDAFHAPDPKDARIAALEAKLDALTTFQGLTVRDMGGGVYEVVKQTEFPAGDYLHPIPFSDGMTVEEGLWYYADDPDLPAECVQGGVAKSYGAPWLVVIG